MAKRFEILLEMIHLGSTRRFPNVRFAQLMLGVVLAELEARRKIIARLLNRGFFELLQATHVEVQVHRTLPDVVKRTVRAVGLRSFFHVLKNDRLFVHVV